LAGTASDNEGGVIAAKYTWNQFKFYAGWSHVIYRNPADNVGIGATNDAGGYILSQVNNAAFPHAKLLDTEWAGVKYSYDSKTDIVVAYYHEGQNGFGSSAQLATCGLVRYIASTQATPRSGNCAGDLNAASFYVDYHFTKRFDIYGGMMVSTVGGGFASGYYFTTNWAPAAGVRFTF
jgi:predicted porin